MKAPDPSRHPFADIQLARRVDLLAWGRSRSVWPFNWGLSCCYVELATALTSKFDLARFGSEIIRGSPREADVMVVAGTVFKKFAPMVRHMWEQMMAPRWVVAMGSCASSGGMYDIYSVVQGVDSFLPVDIYIQGCPPSPDSFMRGLTLLQDSIAQEQRPLSWVVGPQGVVKPPRPSMRDIMRDERRDRGGLEPPDRV